MRISDWSSDVCSSDLEQTEHEARDVQVITRGGCERLFDFCFRLAERRRAGGRPGVLTCVDKANVLGSMVFFRRIFDERASLFPAVEARYRYVDATAPDQIGRASCRERVCQYG